MPDRLNPPHAEIQTGDIYWCSSGHSDIAHPHVVIEFDATENTVTVCALTSNLKRVSLPGNVLLDSGEGNLSRQSVIEVSKRSTIHRSQLGDYIGTLSKSHITQVLAGIRFVRRSFLT